MRWRGLLGGGWLQLEMQVRRVVKGAIKQRDGWPEHDASCSVFHGQALASTRANSDAVQRLGCTP